MHEQNITSKPEFTVTDSEDSILAKLIEQDIFARPEAYRTVLVLGSLATVEASDDNPIDGDVIRRVEEYFKYRIDKAVSFDNDTEDALAGDIEHSSLIRSIGKTQNPERKIERRDQVRQNRLAFFVDRVIDWQRQESSQNDNLRPSA